MTIKYILSVNSAALARSGFPIPVTSRMRLSQTLACPPSSLTLSALAVSKTSPDFSNQGFVPGRILLRSSLPTPSISCLFSISFLLRCVIPNPIINCVRLAENRLKKRTPRPLVFFFTPSGDQNHIHSFSPAWGLERQPPHTVYTRKLQRLFLECKVILAKAQPSRDGRGS